MTEVCALMRIAEAVGDRVAEQSLLVAATGLAVLAFHAVFARLGPRLRLALWSLVFLRAVLPPSFAAEISPMTIASAVLDRPSALSEARAPVFFHPWLGANGDPLGSSTSPARLASWRLWLGVAWIVGASWGLTRCVRRRTSAQRTAAGAKIVSGRVGPELVERWRRRFGVRRRVVLRVSRRNVGPFTMGTFRPVIVIPRAVAERPQVAETAVAHEMAHIARCDDLQLVVQQVIQAMFFFHPVLWLAGMRIEAERELCADAQVLATSDIAPRRYALNLLEAAGLGLRTGPRPAFFGKKRRISMRIRSIVSWSKSSTPSWRRTAVVLCLAALLALPLAASKVEHGATSGPSSTRPQADLAESVGETRGDSVSQGTAAAASLELQHPLPEARLTMGWGEYRHPMTARPFHHRGLDLATTVGTPIHAAAGGVVTTALVDWGDAATGRYVVIAHSNGVSTYYGHVDDVLVTVGERVDSGQPIATVGSTGLSTGPHLHFEVRVKGEAVDPRSVLTTERSH